MHRPSLPVPALVALALLGPAIAAAGTVVTSESTADGRQTLAVQGGHVRLAPERKGAPGLLFEAGPGRLVLLNRPAKQYNVIDRDRLDAMAARVAAERERLSQAVAAASGDERRRLQRRLERLPGTAGPAIAFAPAGERRTINGRDCEVVDARIAGTRTHRLCLVGVASLGLDGDSRRTLAALFDFLARLRNLLGRAGKTAFDARVVQAALAERSAFPVWIERVDDGATWTVRAVEHREQPADRFRVPPDYTEGARLGAG